MPAASRRIRRAIISSSIKKEDMPRNRAGSVAYGTLMRSLVLLVLLAPLAAADSPPWLTDLDQAFAAARKSGQPLFIVLSCPH
jgi:hypothetical protein